MWRLKFGWRHFYEKKNSKAFVEGYGWTKESKRPSELYCTHKYWKNYGNHQKFSPEKHIFYFLLSGTEFRRFVKKRIYLFGTWCRMKRNIFLLFKRRFYSEIHGEDHFQHILGSRNILESFLLPVSVRTVFFLSDKIWSHCKICENSSSQDSLLPSSKIKAAVLLFQWVTVYCIQGTDQESHETSIEIERDNVWRAELK